MTDDDVVVVAVVTAPGTAMALPAASVTGTGGRALVGMPLPVVVVVVVVVANPLPLPPGPWGTVGTTEGIAEKKGAPGKPAAGGGSGSFVGDLRNLRDLGSLLLLDGRRLLLVLDNSRLILDHLVASLLDAKHAATRDQSEQSLPVLAYIRESLAERLGLGDRPHGADLTLCCLSDLTVLRHLRHRHHSGGRERGVDRRAVDRRAVDKGKGGGNARGHRRYGRAHGRHDGKRILEDMRKVGLHTRRVHDDLQTASLHLLAPPSGDEGDEVVPDLALGEQSRPEDGILGGSPGRRGSRGVLSGVAPLGHRFAALQGV